jgi:hypothetical protein
MTDLYPFLAGSYPWADDYTGAYREDITSLIDELNARADALEHRAARLRMMIEQLQHTLPNDDAQQSTSPPALPVQTAVNEAESTAQTP